MTKEEWLPILSRLNNALLNAKDFEDDLTPEERFKAWCGSPPASEEEILKTEARLGLTLPPSYRSFLSISNGWRLFDTLVERLLPVQEIERYRDADPGDLAAILKMREDEVSDRDYLDYEDPEHNEALRHRYYPESILVGKGWGVESERILLNPKIVSDGGEWETIYFANWIPGNYRYRSFRDFVEDSVSSLEKEQTNKP